MANKVVTRSEWLQHRAELLKEEKAHTHERARLAKRRQKFPWVKLDKPYTFDSTEGPVTLSELFLDRSQLAIYHLMFGPDWETPCSGCTSWANAFNGTNYLFKQADARLIAVSRAPIEQIEPQRVAKQWHFTWVSSYHSDFNYDFYASSTDQGPESSMEIGGPGGERVWFERGENHGVSIFVKDEQGELFHTYSTYNRGIEAMHGAFGYFDLLPKGRAW